MYALFIVTLMAIPLRNLNAHQIQNAINRLYHTANRQDNPLNKEMENRVAGPTTKWPHQDVVQRVQPTFGRTGPLAGLPIDHDDVINHVLELQESEKCQRIDR